MYKQKQQTIQTKREMQHRKKQESKRKTTFEEELHDTHSKHALHDQVKYDNKHI